MQDLNTTFSELSAEVFRVFQSEQFLSNHTSYSTRVACSGKKDVHIRIVSNEQYLQDIDIHNESSACVELDEGTISSIELSFFNFSYHDMHDNFQHASDEATRLSNLLMENDKLRVFATQFAATQSTIDPEELYSHIISRPILHGTAILYARVILMGRRYAILEAVLEAYKDGLLPFGWDLETDSILAIRPVID